MLKTMRSITSRQNPLVRVFRELAASPPLDGSRLLLDGVHLVQEARTAGLTFGQVAVSSQHADNDAEVAELAALLESEGVDVVAVTEPVMGALSPVRTPSGIVAIVTRTPTQPTEICRHSEAFVVAPVDVQDPGNLGALLRAAEAGGATGAVACGVAPKALLACARKFGLKAIASVPRGGSNPEALDWGGRVLLFVGGEGAGVGQ